MAKEQLSPIIIKRLFSVLRSIQQKSHRLQQDEPYVEGEVKQLARFIEQEAHQMQSLLEMLPGFSSFINALQPSELKPLKKQSDVLLNDVSLLTEQLMGDGKADIEHIAAEMAMSPSMLRRKLSAATDYTPSNYLLHLRIEFSKRYLDLYPQVTIIDTAYRCGFSDNAHFTKVFHRFTGLTPLQYIKGETFVTPVQI